MKALLQSTVAWVNQKISTKAVQEVEAPIPAEPVHAVPSVAPVAYRENSAPVLQTQPAPVVRVKPKRMPEPIPERLEPFQKVITNEGPELALVNKGSKLYGTCPHCTATWSVAERLMHPRFQRLETSKGLTCPACDKPVSLPVSANLQKPS